MTRTVLAFLLLGTPVPALAQTAPVPPADDANVRPGGRMLDRMFLRSDANGDGVVTRAEAIAAADARFDRLDIDHNSNVTPEERRAALDRMRGRSGSDGPPRPATEAKLSGRVRPAPRTMSREDWRAQALDAFNRADANGDGTIDRTELARRPRMRRPLLPGDGRDTPRSPRD